MADSKDFSGIDFKKLARSITLIENESPGYEQLLMEPGAISAKIIGITGAPGAGKSSLADALIGEMTGNGKKVGVICVDPSSPFNRGALLGDRIRMSEWYNHPDVFIRSLASRGSLGGLNPKVIEISGLMKSAGFDYVIIETVGVGQSEVDIAALADITVVMLVPEGGDAIQTMKAGLMEVADIFVINKSDRPGAESFFHTLRGMVRSRPGTYAEKTPIIRTIATNGTGIAELYRNMAEWNMDGSAKQKAVRVAEMIWSLLQQMAVKEFDKEEMTVAVSKALEKPGFNLYRFAVNFFENQQAGGRN